MNIPEPQGLSAETKKEFDLVCDEIAAVFSRFAVEGKDFDIEAQTLIGCSVDVIILNYQVVTPQLIEANLAGLVNVLRSHHDYWLLRLWLHKETKDVVAPDQCIWMELTKHGVAPYRGLKQVEVFASMEDLYAHYWERQSP